VHKTFLLPSRHSGIQLDFDNDTDRDLVLVDADPTKLSQVMRNLVSNAMKFTPAGGSCRLMLTLNKRLERVRLEVHDSGPGMTREQRARLFKEMVQFNARELQGGQGSGMGLFLSRRIIELHGGLIGVDMDREQPGSMFYIELPISANEESNPQGDRIFLHCFRVVLYDACVYISSALPKYFICWHD
jgi:two-component system phosphate regulon sensor histidine kinase PhoR